MKTSQEKILFVHGAWHGAWCWEAKFIPYFSSQGFDCHTFNLRGHDKAGNVNINQHRIRDYTADLRAEVKRIGEDVTIVGHSMGGLVVQKYLEEYPCKRAVLLAPVPVSGVFPVTIKFLSKGYARVGMVKRELYRLIDTPEKARWAFFSDTLPAAEVETYTKQLCSESFMAFLGMVVPNIKLNYHTKIPMLVIGAENDQIFTVQEVTNTAKKYNAELHILPDMAHDIMLEPNWQIAADKMMSWVNEN